MQEDKNKKKHDRGQTFAHMSPPQNHHETHRAKQKPRRTTGTLRQLHTHRVWTQAHARQQTERLGDERGEYYCVTCGGKRNFGKKKVSTLSKQMSGVYLKGLKKCYFYLWERCRKHKVMTEEMCKVSQWRQNMERVLGGGDSTWVLEGSGAFESQKSRSET